MNCTFTTACFNLTKYHNKSRSISVSLTNMVSLLKSNCYLVIYTDIDFIDAIKEIRAEYDALTKYIVLEFEEIESYKYIDIVNQNREKFWPTRDERTCSENHLLNSNKSNFVLQTMELNPFNTTYFGWIDSNIGINFSKICTNFKPEYISHITTLNKKKFYLQILNVNDKKYKTNKHEYYQQYRWVMCGCFFITEKEIGKKILNRLNEIFIDTTLMGYGHGDEMYYLEILDEFYDDIEKSYGDYGQILNNFINPTQNLHYIYYLIINRYLDFQYYRECYDCCQKVLYSIENNIIEYSEELYMNILYAYYFSAYHLDNNYFVNDRPSPISIINNIYSICNKNNKMKEEFNKKKIFYEEQFLLSKKSYNVIINVFACPTIEKYKNEILKINKTWGATAEQMGIKVLFFFGEEQTDLIGDNYIYLPGVKNDYESASWKQYLGLKYIYDNYNANFIYTCGTDTFINIKKLLSYLDIFNRNKKLYIGGHGDIRMVGNLSIYYHSGSGFIITNKILNELYPQLDGFHNQWGEICKKYNIVDFLLCACDVSIAYFITNIKDVETVKNENFYACNYLGHYCCLDKMNIHDIISCHRMSLDDFDNYQKILDIYNNYNKLCNTPSDINEHLPTLYQLSKECNSVLELGVRGVVSSWAFTYGLMDHKNKKLLFLNDLQECNISELLEYAKNLNIEIKYEWKNCLNLDFGEYKFDMVFIDTWHIYGQLKRELAKFSKITNKYIVMHDTTVDEFDGETIRCGFNPHQQSIESGFPIEEILQGLGRAIDEFLLENTNWIVKKKYTNNNGLTILEKIN